jgi:hypothetical protein
MYVSDMSDVRLLKVERCSVLIGVGVSAVTIGTLLLTVCSSYIFSVWIPLVSQHQKEPRTQYSKCFAWKFFVWGLKKANSYSRNMLPA